MVTTTLSDSLFVITATLTNETGKAGPPLCLAATNGHTRSIDVLVNYGKADKMLKDLSGTNAYQYAKNCGHGNNKLIKTLLLNSTQNYPHELKGRAMSTRSEPPPQVNYPNGYNKDLKKEVVVANPDIYNPYETNAFSSSLWKPIKSDLFKHFRQNEIGSTESLASNGFSCSPPESNTLSDGFALSSSQSSQCSAISLPPDYKRKSAATRKKSTLIPIPAVMPKTLFHLLTRLDLIQYLDLFESNGIDFYQFLTLTDLDFQKLGITCYGHRKRLSVAQLRYHESLDITCSQESFLTDYLLNERETMSQRIHELEQKLKRLATEEK